MSRSKKVPINYGKLQSYSVPNMKLKNVHCVACKHKFYVQDLMTLNGLILEGSQVPLLLKCGHPICSKCTKKNLDNCPSCNKTIMIYDDCNQIPLFPLNLYTLGLILSSYHSPFESDDKDFEFRPTLPAQLRNITKKGNCHECGHKANVKCLQCAVLFCQSCYANMHRRALQFHTHVLIYNGDPDNPAATLNRCSESCTESLSFFCDDCNVACCSTCTLRMHKLHNFMPLSEKNEALLPEFNQIYSDIQENLLRVYQTNEVSTHSH